MDGGKYCSTRTWTTGPVSVQAVGNFARTRASRSMKVISQYATICDHVDTSLTSVHYHVSMELARHYFDTRTHHLSFLPLRSVKLDLSFFSLSSTSLFHSLPYILPHELTSSEIRPSRIFCSKVEQVHLSPRKPRGETGRSSRLPDPLPTTLSSHRQEIIKGPSKRIIGQKLVILAICSTNQLKMMAKVDSNHLRVIGNQLQGENGKHPVPSYGRHHLLPLI